MRSFISIRLTTAAGGLPECDERESQSDEREATAEQDDDGQGELDGLSRRRPVEEHGLALLGVVQQEPVRQGRRMLMVAAAARRAVRQVMTGSTKCAAQSGMHFDCSNTLLPSVHGPASDVAIIRRQPLKATA